MSVTAPAGTDVDLVRAALAGADPEMADRGCAGLAARRWVPGDIVEVRRAQLLSEVRHAPAAPDLLPDAMADLRAAAATTWSANVEALDAAGTVLSALAAAGITTMAFKGAILAVSNRPDLSHRPVGDLDVLVHPRDVPAAARVLGRCGLHGGPCGAERLRHSGAWEPDRDGPRLAGVDLHWRILPASGAAHDEELWDAAVAAPARCGPVLAPDPADHLVVVLAAAGERGPWPHLRWMVDSVRLAADPMLDWDRLVRTAVRWGRPRRTAEALAVARSVVRLPVPEDAVEHLASCSGERLADWAESTRWWQAAPEALTPWDAAARLFVVAASASGSFPGTVLALADHLLARRRGQRPVAPWRTVAGHRAAQRPNARSRRGRVSANQSRRRSQLDWPPILSHISRVAPKASRPPTRR